MSADCDTNIISLSALIPLYPLKSAPCVVIDTEAVAAANVVDTSIACPAVSCVIVTTLSADVADTPVSKSIAVAIFVANVDPDIIPST